jgi:hypothetical protein
MGATTVVELAPAIDAYDAAVAANDRILAASRAQAIIDVVESYGAANVTINGKGVAGNPDTGLQDAWATVIGVWIKTLRDVVKFNAPVIAVPAFPG